MRPSGDGIDVLEALCQPLVVVHQSHSGRGRVIVAFTEHKEVMMTEFQAIADRVEIEALRGEYVDQR